MKHFWPSVSALRILFVYFTANLPVIWAVTTLHVGGLFPMSGPSAFSAGKSLLSASELAIDLVNSRTDVLPGYRLQLIWNDTQVFNDIFVYLIKLQFP